MGELLNIYEVGPRDGLQNESKPISTPSKLQLIRGLVGAGIRELEATSFVSPRAVPQMADASDVIAALSRLPSLRASALVINDKGYDRAVAAGARAVAIVAVVSEPLCARNNRMTVEQSLTTAARLGARANRDGLWARIYIAPAWVCPYAGAIDPDRVLAAADRLAPACDQLVVSDTVGYAHPKEVGALTAELVRRFGADRLAVHLHDTQAMGLANAAAAIVTGIRNVDSAVGGLGGCPFTRGAAGNLATEDLVLMAHKMGFETGVNLDALWGVVADAETMVGRPLGGRTKAWWRPQAQRGTRI